jgi:isopropylmalate/homocitrate/citramalate synthase
VLKSSHATSYANFIPEVKAQEHLPERIVINDITLREGEQTPGVALSDDEKMKIAEALCDIGVDQIQFSAREDIKLLKRYQSSGLKVPSEALVTGFANNAIQLIDAAVECKPDIIQIIFRSSDYMLRHALNITRDQMVERSIELIRYAKDKGVKLIAFGPTDATRTEIEFLKKVCASAVEAGARRLSLNDTLGVAKPAAIKYLVEQVKSVVDVPIGLHCHNDFGLALANTLAGLEGGAQIVDVSVNGLGDRCGNTSLDELAVALKELYHIELKIKMEKLSELAKLVEHLTQVKIPHNKPIVGQDAFAEKTDSHVLAKTKMPFIFEPFDPAMVGNRSWIAIGKGTGPNAIKSKATELGITVDEKLLPEIVKAANQMAMSKKALLSDGDLKILLENFNQKPPSHTP